VLGAVALGVVALLVAALWNSTGSPVPIEPRDGRRDAAGTHTPSQDPVPHADRSALGLAPDGSDGTDALRPIAAATASPAEPVLVSRVAVALARPEAVAGPWRVRAQRLSDAGAELDTRGEPAARTRPASVGASPSGASSDTTTADLASSSDARPDSALPDSTRPDSSRLDRSSARATAERTTAERAADDARPSAAPFDSPWSPDTTAVLELELAVGPWELAAHGAAWSTAPLTLDVVAATHAVVLEPRLDTRLVGRCVGRDGSPLAGVDLGLLATGTPPQRAERFAARTDVDGVFVVEAFPAGPGQLVCGDHTRPFVEPRAFEARAPTTDLGTLVFEPLAALTVEVVDAAGARLAGVDVVVTGHPLGEHRARTDLDGRILVAGVPATEGRAFADVPGLGRGNTPFQFDPSAPRTVVVRLLRREDDPRAR